MKNSEQKFIPTVKQQYDDGTFLFEGGLTKREYFAAMAMQGFITSKQFDKTQGSLSDKVGERWENYVRSITIQSIEMSDSLLTQLEQTKP